MLYFHLILASVIFSYSTNFGMAEPAPVNIPTNNDEIIANISILDSWLLEELKIQGRKSLNLYQEKQQSLKDGIDLLLMQCPGFTHNQDQGKLCPALLFAGKYGCNIYDDIRVVVLAHIMHLRKTGGEMDAHWQEKFSFGICFQCDDLKKTGFRAIFTQHPDFLKQFQCDIIEQLELEDRNEKARKRLQKKLKNKKEELDGEKKEDTKSTTSIIKNAKNNRKKKNKKGKPFFLPNPHGSSTAIDQMD